MRYCWEHNRKHETIFTASTIFLCLPVLFIAIAGTLFSVWREEQRQAKIARFSQPFQPRLEIMRSSVPSGSQSLLFEAQVRTVPVGGRGQSQWLLHAQLFDVSGTSPREVWNSQKSIIPETVSHVMTYNSVSGDEQDWHWRFKRHDNHTSQPLFTGELLFVVEAVAVPVPASDAKVGKFTGVSVREATPAQIAAAKEQPGAQYLKKSLTINTRDDNKYRHVPVYP